MKPRRKRETINAAFSEAELCATCATDIHDGVFDVWFDWDEYYDI
jgi:hypothetical protein